MRRWSEASREVAATRRTSEKVARLAAYLRSLDPESLPIGVTFLAGRPFPGRAQQVLGLGWSAVGQAIESVALGTQGGRQDDSRTPGTASGQARSPSPRTTRRSSLARHYDASSDLGQAAHDLLAEVGHRPSGPEVTLAEVRDAFEGIAGARGTGAKGDLFRSLIARLDAYEVMAIVKVVGRDMRIGLREGHLEAAIAAAFDQDVEAVRWAAMLTGDLGQVATLARDGRLDAARLVLFRPLTSMLASPVADAEEVIARLGVPVWVEDKYDGIRAQLHRRGQEARLYSRDLNEISAAFPEVIEAAGGLPWEGALDGELLAWRDGAALPFLDLQARLGRKRPPIDLLAATPVIFVAFDLLAWGEGSDRPIEPLLRRPLRERRARLEALGLNGRPGFGISRLEQAGDALELEALFMAARGRGNEGLMVKDPESTYAPGRRGYGWLKLKRPLATLDCVVVGVEVGHGKRHGVLSDYTFAVLDDRPGAKRPLATIGKAYSGLSDAELAEMTRWFEGHTLERFGRYRAVEPTVVVEVAFDVVQPSRRHASGYALRFPRIARLRPDKTPADADRLSTVAELADRRTVAPSVDVLTAGERRVC
jgi:ATP-dependent DNA ligase I